MAATINDQDIDKQSAEYAGQVVELLRQQLVGVIAKRQPAVLPMFLGDTPLTGEDGIVLQGLLQSWGIWFQLLSIAEENTGMRRRRLMEKRFGPDQVPGAFSSVLRLAQEQGVDATAVRQLLHKVHIRPTLTAHPTEAKRITVLEIHRRIYVLLYRLESDRWTQRERDNFILSLYNEIDLLWLTGELRLERPTISQEVVWGLHFFNQTLYEQVPMMLQNLQRALGRLWPAEDFSIPPFFQFGSWIGGDRDGNPLVTHEATREALIRHRQHVLRHYVKALRTTIARISLARALVTVDESFTGALERMLEASGIRETINKRNPGEIFRQFAHCILLRLEATLAASTSPGQGPAAYENADQFIADLDTLWQGLVAGDCRNLADDLVRPLLHKARTFRFRSARLDIRENSIVINHTLKVIWHGLRGAETPFPEGQQRTAWLLESLREPAPELPDASALDETTVSTLQLFQLLAEQDTGLDSEAIGAFILSMTGSANDILSVYLLGKYTGLLQGVQGDDSLCCPLPIVPLFETIEDLQAAPKIMQELLTNELVRRSIAHQGGTQEVMIGYSDSNKDGGFFTANHLLHQVQERIHHAIRDSGVLINFFHGRGGSASRGGVAIGRAIAAQPRDSIRTRLRITEQGEVVSYKYANQGTAQSEMELLAGSVLEHMLGISAPQALQREDFDQAMELLSGLAYRHYRQLLDSRGFMTYYQIASPIRELDRMNIGSRPARRFHANSLNNLRAIPWVFAWTQNRHLVPGWYGVGHALSCYCRDEGAAGRRLLGRMFEESRLFRLIIDEVEKSLSLVDMVVCEHYAGLVEDNALRADIFDLVQEEYRRTVQEILALTGEQQLGVRFRRFHRKLHRRLGILQRAGCKQVALLRHYRNTEPRKIEDLIALLLSINCVSAGLGWTG